MQKKKGFFAIFFLLVLMLVKISSFHVFTHEDTDNESIENCNLCEFAVENEKIDYTLNSETNFVKPILQVLPIAKTSFVNPVLDTSLSTYRLFTRPPPTFI